MQFRTLMRNRSHSCMISSLLVCLNFMLSRVRFCARANPATFQVIATKSIDRNNSGNCWAINGAHILVRRDVVIVWSCFGPSSLSVDDSQGPQQQSIEGNSAPVEFDIENLVSRRKTFSFDWSLTSTKTVVTCNSPEMNSTAS